MRSADDPSPAPPHPPVRPTTDDTPPDQAGDPAQPPGDDLFRTLLDATFEGVLLHDGVIHYANRAAGRITGYAPEALVGMPVSGLYAKIGCDHAGVPMPVSMPEATPEATYGPMRFMGTGRTGHAIIEAQGRTVAHGGRLVWMSAFRDISAHVAAEVAMRRRADLEDLVISISAGFIHLEADEVYGALAAALQRIGEFAGVDRAYMYLIEGERMRATSLWVPASGAHSFDDWTLEVGDFDWAIERLRKDESVVYEKRETFEPMPDGSRRTLPAPRLRSSCCVPMLVRDALIGYVGFDAFRPAKEWQQDTVKLLRTVGYIFASVLQRKAVQEQLARAYANMEQEVQKRTRELQQQQGRLLQAEKMASLGQLVAGVAHEINTPLGAIKSNTDTLSRALRKLRALMLGADGADGAPREPGEPGEPGGQAGAGGRAAVVRLLDASEKLNAVDLEATERIARIVSSLRTFARLDRAERGRIDLHAAIDNTLTLVQHALRHRVDVRRDYGKLPEIECFPNLLNQVFMNLLVNASQAIDDRGEIRIGTRDLGDGRVRLCFSDDGHGIAPQHLARIFDPGFTTKGVGIGTGLGLSIVHQIVEEHGGRIEVDSQPGRGTTFSLTLPIAGSDERPTNL